MDKPARKPQRNIIETLAYTLGFTSIISQILLMRELIIVFYGNETAYAAILASWLFWIAAGSFTISRLTKKIKKPKNLLADLLWVIYFILPATVILTRFLKQIMRLQAGEMISIFPMYLSSFLLLAPLTFIIGSIFTLICCLPSKEEEILKVGKIYLWEAKGAIFGGLTMSFILIPFLPAMHIAFLVGIINIAVMIFLRKHHPRLLFTGLSLIIITLLAYFSGTIDKVDYFTRQEQWKDFQIVTVTDSIYGNIVLTKSHHEYSLYENGLLAYSTKDALTNEENIHYALLEHPHPKDVLLIGGGIAGGLREALKHPIAKIDYVELDSKVIDIFKKYLPKEALTSLSDKRVNIINTDARLLIKRSSKKYDVIIVNLGDPTTAMVNRYYSLEFFNEAKKILQPGGILSLSVTSSENYLNKEARTFLQSIHTTLSIVFPDVLSIPGDTNIFLACRKKHVLTYDPKILIQRLNSRHIETKYIREYYLPFKLSEDRISYIQDVLKEKGAINTDMHPVAYLYDIILWSTRFNLVFKKVIEKIQWIQLRHLMIFPAVLLFIGFVRRKKSANFPITASIITTGFSEIIFQIIVIIAFQTLYGFAYYKIGLIMTSFMIGLALGSYCAQKLLMQENANIMRVYKMAQAAIVFYPLTLPYLFIIFRDATSTQNLTAFSTTFALLPIIAGLIGGLQYPLATHLVSGVSGKERKDNAFYAGSLYAADTLGATVGAFLTGAFLIPLLGIKAVALFCAGINLAVFILLLAHPQPTNLSARV